MAQLGDVIGSLLADAARARVQADIESIKIAESYAASDLLRRLPVPRFRLPEISVEIPVLIAAEPARLKGGPPIRSAPTAAELRAIVEDAASRSGTSLTPRELNRIGSAAAASTKAALQPGARSLLSAGRIAKTVSSDAARSLADLLQSKSVDPAPADTFRVRLAEGLHRLLNEKMEASPQLQVRVTAAELKAHADSGSIVRVRLTIVEDAYELVESDGGDVTLVPE